MLNAVSEMYDGILAKKYESKEKLDRQKRLDEGKVAVKLKVLELQSAERMQRERLEHELKLATIHAEVPMAPAPSSTHFDPNIINTPFASGSSNIDGFWPV
jgi:hypothetical protein